MDVACGAAACGAMFAEVFDVHVRPQGYASLALSVWIIYTVDHLLDARQVKEKASTARHRFHQQYFNLMVLLTLVAVVFDLVLVGFIRKPILEAGLIAAVIVFIYLLIQKRLKSFKELAVALLYTGGVLLPALSLNRNSINAGQVFMITAFLVTALINLMLFSWFELEQDLHDHHTSFVVLFGPERTRKVLIVLALVQVLLLIISFLLTDNKPAVIMLTCMNLVLAMLFWQPEGFRGNDQYRLYGDAIFLFPALLLLGA